MKKFILAAGMLSSAAVYSQVGIDTETPKATLQVMGKASDPAKADGIIAPRLTGSELKAKDAAYGANQNAALVYVTTPLATTDTSTKTINVISSGYYYYDAPNNVWVKMNTSTNAGNIEPWYNAATNQPADSNTQDIYQMGKVGVGTIPSATSPYQLHVLNTGATDDTAAKGGINNFLNNQGSGNSIGILNSVVDNSTSTTAGGSTYGIQSNVSDVSKKPHSGYGASISYNLTGFRNNGAATHVHGGANSVTLNAVGGDLISGYSYANYATARATASTGNLTLYSLRGYSGYSIPSSNSGFTFTGNQIFGALLSARPQGNGEMNLGGIYGVHGSLLFEKTGGTLNVSNHAMGMRSSTVFHGEGTYNIDKLMGLLVSKEQTGTSTAVIKNSYGIFIEPYRFIGDTEENAYNLFSDGANTKNYFSGKVGIGTKTPSTKLEVNNGTINGAIKIVDGTQGEGKVLTSDANGVGTWRSSASLKTTALGVFPSADITTRSDLQSLNTTGTDPSDPQKYTGVYIDLEPGKWVVNSGMTIYCFKADLTHFQHAYLSNSQTAVVQNDFQNLGPGANTAFAGKISNGSVEGIDADPQRNANFLSGSSVINVTQPTRIYLLLENKPDLYWSYSTSAWENYFYAIPINN